MATIDSPEIIQNIIQNNGRYTEPGEPPDDLTLKIVRYTNNWGGTAYGVVSELDPPLAYDRYETSPDCHNPVVIWEKGELKEESWDPQT